MNRPVRSNPVPAGDAAGHAVAVAAVAEFQGIYGPFVCPERVLQKIWLRGEFARGRATTTDGERVEVVRAGKWNLLGGPDFRGAELRIGGRVVEGDVEVHFHARDWDAHGHAANPEYARVVLHVLLFPPPADAPPCRRCDGRELPALVLLPLLLRDLEEFVSDDGLEVLTARDDWRAIAELGSLPTGELRRLLRDESAARWRQKVRFASARIGRLGWSAAAHHTALEVLGYRLNRATMLQVAEHLPLAWWEAGGDLEEAWAAGEPGWSTHGVRPANQPRARLRQYAGWVRAVPDWPERLRATARTFGRSVADGVPQESGADGGEGRTSQGFRRVRELTRTRAWMAAEVTGGAVGGTRLDNLVCDGFLPLLAADGGGDALFAWWYHWLVGDVPGRLRAALARLALVEPPEHPNCQGIMQGVLGWMLRRELDASARLSRNLPDA